MLLKDSGLVGSTVKVGNTVSSIEGSGGGISVVSGMISLGFVDRGPCVETCSVTSALSLAVTEVSRPSILPLMHRSAIDRY
jgi:hypothetical protein